MKKSPTILQRQNDSEAIKLLKASKKCLAAERVVKYILIALSFAICLVAILNKYLPQMLPEVENVDLLQQTAATYINLISGAIIVMNLVLGFYCSRMHIEGVVLQDRYEAYVFDNAPNHAMLRPISQTYVERYAHSVHKADAKFKNSIYPPDTHLHEPSAQYEYIKSQVRFEYDLYLAIQPFFLTIWIGFCIIIILIAVSFNDMFVTTLINILIPSLSAITTICTSWYNCRLQMRQLNNLMNCIERIEDLSQERRRHYIANKENMRLLADGLFNYRASPFMIPNFLVNSHRRAMEKSFTEVDPPAEPETPRTRRKPPKSAS